jgi:hypothetical protein
MTDFSESVRIVWTGPGSASLSGTVTKTNTGEGGLSIPVPATTSNLQINLVMDVSQIALMYMKSTVDMTLKTNSIGSPTNNITLAAGVPQHYLSSSGMTLQCTGDVTTAYVSNAGAVDGTFDIRFLYDATT